MTLPVMSYVFKKNTLKANTAKCEWFLILSKIWESRYSRLCSLLYIYFLFLKKKSLKDILGSKKMTNSSVLGDTLNFFWVGGGG